MKQRKRHLSAKDEPTPPGGEARRLRPEWVFAGFTLLAGLSMVFITPPFQVPDEWTHFFRAFQLSEGRLVAQRKNDSVGGWLPESMFRVASAFAYMPRTENKVDKTVLRQQLLEPLLSEQRAFCSFPNTAPYSPVQYIPQIGGIWLSRACGVSVMVMMYIGRLFNLLCWTAVVVAAIRISPMFKWTIVLVALMPMSVFLAASFSSDPMTIAPAILLTAFILRYRMAGKRPMGWKERSCILLLCAIVGPVKQVYFPLALIPVLIPYERFGSRRSKAMFCCLAFGLALMANLVWFYMIRKTVEPHPWAAPDAQLMFVLSEPWNYATIIARTLSVKGTEYLAGFVGVLGWMDTLLPKWIYWSYIPMLLCVAVLEKNEVTLLTRRDRGILVAIVAAISLLIATSVYLTYSSLRESIVRGVQGRYFIPLAVPALLVLSNRKLNLTDKWIGRVIYVYCAIVLVTTCVTIVNRYYD